MRPLPQSYLRYPLSTLLGSEASVRVLRELTLHGAELTTTLLARRIGVTDQSVRNVLDVLRQTGLVKVYGQGRAVSYEIYRDHPLAPLLVALFEGEDRRAKTIHDRIRQVAARLKPMAVWLFGSAARGEDRIGSDLDLLLVAEADEETERAADSFRKAMAPIETDHHVSISVVPVSGDDVLRLARTEDPFWREILADAQPLHGPMPETLLSRLRRMPESYTSAE
jgi:predicted nucleotidyltransferase